MDLILGGYLKKFVDMKTFRCFETKDYNLDKIIKINSVENSTIRVKSITNHVTRI